jgi:hypothetical protein
VKTTGQTKVSQAASHQPTLETTRKAGYLRLSDDYVGFALLNLFDLCLTATIFHHGGKEVNPIGYAVMDRCGLGGYVLFKFALVAIVVSACDRIDSLRPSAARRLINAANLVYVGIILWECVLLAFR